MERRAIGNNNLKRETYMGISKSQQRTATVLDRIAWLSAQDPEKEFYSLMHHINLNSLRDCFTKLEGKKAVGADGVTKRDYGDNLEAKSPDTPQTFLIQ